MRFLTAAILFIMSMLLILVGIAERTIWLPPAAYVESVHIGAKTPLNVISHAALTQYPGNPVLTVYGDRQIFVAVGRNTDVNAWVGSTSHTEISLDSKNASGHGLKAKVSDGSGLRTNPVGSDLWRSELTGSMSVRSSINVNDGASVLIASDGLSLAPQDVTLNWPIVFDSTPSGILIIVGAIFLLAAIVMNFWAWYNLRRDRGPRRRTPKAPQGPRSRRRRGTVATPKRGRRSARNFTAVVAGGLVLASLSGCASVFPTAPSSASNSASASPKQDLTKTAPPVVTEDQLRTIISKIADTVGKADASKSVQVLQTRMAGPALNSRAAYYKLQAATKFAGPLTPIGTKHITFALPAAENTWPRVVMAVTSNGTKNELPQMLVLEQAGPREQYQVWYDINMLPGVKTPMVASAKVGAIPVNADSLFLKIAPKALPTAFGNLIDLGQASLSAPVFNISNDEFYKQVAASLAQQKASLTKATLTVTHSLGNDNVLSLATVGSGAMVAVYLNDTYVIKPKDRTQAVAVTGMEKKLLGASGSITGIKSVYGTMLLFYVPAVTSTDKIITLGATQFLISIKAL
jgi:hypothetical protein